MEVYSNYTSNLRISEVNDAYQSTVIAVVVIAFVLGLPVLCLLLCNRATYLSIKKLLNIETNDITKQQEQIVKSKSTSSIFPLFNTKSNDSDNHSTTNNNYKTGIVDMSSAYPRPSIDPILKSRGFVSFQEYSIHFHKNTARDKSQDLYNHNNHNNKDITSNNNSSNITPQEIQRNSHLNQGNLSSNHNNNNDDNDNIQRTGSNDTTTSNTKMNIKNIYYEENESEAVRMKKRMSDDLKARTQLTLGEISKQYNISSPSHSLKDSSIQSSKDNSITPSSIYTTPSERQLYQSNKLITVSNNSSSRKIQSILPTNIQVPADIEDTRTGNKSSPRSPHIQLSSPFIDTYSTTDYKEKSSKKGTSVIATTTNNNNNTAAVDGINIAQTIQESDIHVPTATTTTTTIITTPRNNTYESNNNNISNSPRSSSSSSSNNNKLNTPPTTITTTTTTTTIIRPRHRLFIDTDAVKASMIPSEYGPFSHENVILSEEEIEAYMNEIDPDDWGYILHNESPIEKDINIVKSPNEHMDIHDYDEDHSEFNTKFSDDPDQKSVMTHNTATTFTIDPNDRSRATTNTTLNINGTSRITTTSTILNTDNYYDRSRANTTTTTTGGNDNYISRISTMTDINQSLDRSNHHPHTQTHTQIQTPSTPTTTATTTTTTATNTNR